MPRIALAGPSDMVVAAGSLAAAAGGSLVDVVIAAALTATCTDPGICAPGGGGFITIEIPGEEAVVIDGYMAFPGIGFDGDAFTRTVSMEYGGGVTTGVDAGSVAVPGAFAAYAMANERYGSLPWRELMHLTAGLVEDGFPLSQTAHTYLLDAGELIFAQDPTSRSALFDGNALLQHGETVVFTDLAPTLRLIGDRGVGVLYGGELGDSIADDITARGGRLTREDMASYRAIARPPLRADVGDWTILTNPPPAVGGATLLLALAGMAASVRPDSAEVWFECLRDAFVIRTGLIEPAKDREATVMEVLARAGILSSSTIAVAAVDSEGSAVAASFSAGYGSGVVPRGSGMLMNNSVGEIELLPGGVESQSPGQRMLSNMAPTVAHAGNRAIALASPGADRITSALAITLARTALAGDDLVAAIDHPRVHPEFFGSSVRAAAEPGLGLSDLPDEVRRYDSRHMYFGGVAGAALEGSELTAYADKRRVGAVALID